MSAPQTVQAIDQSTHYYLVIRPFSTDPHKIDPYLAPLSELTGLDQATLRQKFTGDALHVLLSGQDAGELEQLSRSLKAEGFPCCVTSKGEILKGPRPVRVTDLDVSQETLRLIAPGGQEITSLNRTQQALLVLSTMNTRELKRKEMVRLVVARDGEYPLSMRLNYIFQNHPVMDIYISGVEKPLRLDSQKFNYHSLGENNRKSVTQNFPALIRLIKQFSDRIMLDAGFGENDLPFLNALDPDHPERLLDVFTLYSRFVYLAYKEEMFRTVHDQGHIPPLPMPGELEGLLWTGPLLGHQSPKEGLSEDTDPATGKTEKDSRILPPPPEPPVKVVSEQISTWGIGLKLFLRQYRRSVRTLGPPVLVYPLTMGFLCSMAVCYAVKQFHFFSAGLIFLGLILFVHSFVMIKRKRALENCPTSRIRSMPMGLVEVQGKARQKYFLKTPYSQTDCVYYSFKKYRWDRTGNAQGYRLEKWGESGEIPFYIEDETGRVLVHPKNAIIKAGVSQDFSKSFLEMFAFYEPGLGGEGDKIVEHLIPAGQSLYVMGYAHPLRTGSAVRRDAFIKKLRRLKKDKGQMMRYDLNRNGMIDEDEWDKARSAMEEAALLDPGTGHEDRIAIGQHPTGGLFYISDKREELIHKLYAWTIPIVFSLGMASCVAGLYLILRSFGM